MTDNPDRLPGMLQGVRVLEVSEPLGALVGRFWLTWVPTSSKSNRRRGTEDATPLRSSARATNASACPLYGPM